MPENNTDAENTDAEQPSREEVNDALFETLAALVDLRERLIGGATRSGVPPEQVFESVWSAYDLEEANEILQQTEYSRDGETEPTEWAVDTLQFRTD